MEQDNKNRIEWGLEVLALILWLVATIWVCASAWNYCPETTTKVVAAVLLAANAYAFYRKAKALRKTFSSFINKSE